ncbi:unnamed protein product [Blepharisma stoltei]|uniref:Vesicle transport v-SNARE N-terminal domain-containing protein n=1 Tax=Blepharisma stoltei TaxID=1481888 RepID=A0AAU9JZY6_9CILI|nr:unnamed protein product [Blepharisma stoltei]
MAELFKAYEKDFSKHLSSANKKLSTLSSSQNSEALLSDSKHDIEEAENTLKLMESEVQKMPPSLSAIYQKNFIRHSDSYQKVKQLINNEITRKNKGDLMGRSPIKGEREKVVSTTEVIIDSGNALDRTLQKGLEAEEMAYGTKRNLLEQRQKILDIKDKVDDVGTNLNAANRTIGVMDKRRIGMKLILYAIIILLIVALAFVLYIKLK